MYNRFCNRIGSCRAGRINSGLSIVALRIIPVLSRALGAPGAVVAYFRAKLQGRIFRAVLKLAPGRISESDPGRNFLQPRGPRRRLSSLVYFLFLSFSLSSALASLKLKVPRCRRSRVESLRKARSLGVAFSIPLHHDATATSATRLLHDAARLLRRCI